MLSAERRRIQILACDFSMGFFEQSDQRRHLIRMQLDLDRIRSAWHRLENYNGAVFHRRNAESKHHLRHYRRYTGAPAHTAMPK